MNVRMLCLAALPALLSGCIRPPEQGDFPPLYHPYDRLSLVCRSEHVMSTRQGKSTTGAEFELLLETRPADLEGHVAMDLQITRVAMSGTYRGSDGSTKFESFDTEKPPTGDDERVAEVRKAAERMKSLRMTATVSADGRILQFGVNGEPMAWAKAPKEADALTDWQTAAICRGILGDSLAYLPPSRVAAGQQWQLVRRSVFPVQVFPVTMLMGNPLLTEKSTCRVVDLRFRPEGRIAVVSFSGRREAILPAEIEARAAALHPAGEARLNLDTGHLEVRVVSTVKFPWRADPGGESRFVDELTLKPVVESEEDRP